MGLEKLLRYLPIPQAARGALDETLPDGTPAIQAGIPRDENPNLRRLRQLAIGTPDDVSQAPSVMANDESAMQPRITTPTFTGAPEGERAVQTASNAVLAQKLAPAARAQVQVPENQPPGKPVAESPETALRRLRLSRDMGGSRGPLDLPADNLNREMFNPMQGAPGEAPLTTATLTRGDRAEMFRPPDEMQADPSQTRERAVSLALARRLSNATDLGGGSTYSGADAEGDAVDSSMRQRWSNRLNKLQSRKDYDEENAPKKLPWWRTATAGALNTIALGLGAQINPKDIYFTPAAYQKLQQREQLAQDDQEIDKENGRQAARAKLEAEQANTDYIKTIKPQIAQSQIASRGALATTREQTMFLQRMKLTGYKRGANPAMDAEADRLFGPGALQDYDPKKAQRPIIRRSNGTDYILNDQTGKFEAAEGIPQDQSGVRVPYRLSDGSVVQVRQDTAATADSAKTAREQARADRQENQSYQRGRDKQADDRYETARREKAITQLRTLRDLYRRAEEAAAYGDERGAADADALIREAGGLSSDIDGAYGDIEGVRDAIQKAKEQQQKRGDSGRPLGPLWNVTPNK